MQLPIKYNGVQLLLRNEDIKLLDKDLFKLN
ncbi:hypothetical protein ACUXCC_002292 [Cytobacillus horneckiae]